MTARPYRCFQQMITGCSLVPEALPDLDGPTMAGGSRPARAVLRVRT